MWTHGSHVDGSWGKIPKKRLEKRIPDDNTIKNFHRVLKALHVFRTLWKIQNQNSLAKGLERSICKPNQLVS